MANTSSAKKAIRSSARKKVFNERRKKAYKAARKAVIKAIEKGNKEEAMKLIPAAYKAIDKAAKANTIHKKTAARYKSRLVAKVKAL
ncbi:MAG: 30S ribosomal protein S20 [Candidatus Dojkabacteria bacterium]